MSHPIELLVSLEDGTLTADERAVLDLHLADCSTCRREAEVAGAARSALRALGTPQLPEGLLDEVASEALRGHGAAGSRVTPIGTASAAARWQRVIGAVGAAAAVVVVVAIALPRLGDGPGDPPTSYVAAGANTQMERGATSTVEVLAEDFDLAGVGALATSSKSGFTEDASATGALSPGSDTAPAAAALDVERATACLRTAFEELPGAPVRLIQARYLGTPAILGVFLIGPGADQPATDARVLVAAQSDCSILVSSQADLRE